MQFVPVIDLATKELEQLEKQVETLNIEVSTKGKELTKLREKARLQRELVNALLKRNDFDVAQEPPKAKE